MIYDQYNLDTCSMKQLKQIHSLKLVILTSENQRRNIDADKEQIGHSCPVAFMFFAMFYYVLSTRLFCWVDFLRYMEVLSNESDFDARLFCNIVAAI